MKPLSRIINVGEIVAIVRGSAPAAAFWLSAARSTAVSRRAAHQPQTPVPRVSGSGLERERNRRQKLVRVGISQPVLAARNKEPSHWILYDALATGRIVRVLSVVDNCTRECLALEADSCFSSQRVTRVLDSVIAQRVETLYIGIARQHHLSLSSQ